MDDFILEMKTLLEKMKEEILGKLKASTAEFHQIIEGRVPKDEIDVASEEIDRTMLAMLDTQDANRLKLIESALAKIEQGKYGICVKCGKQIPRERLYAIPYAFMCIDCKSSDERRNR